jgi:SAM-dependent methyltransferase
MSSPPNPDLLSAMRRSWKETRARHGFAKTSRSFAGKFWEFARESSPAQQRNRYGDAEYDWDHHVNTTGATVGWRDRLLGHFHSPYQPTEPSLFAEMMANLNIDFREFTFIDVGSGKGRVLLMAADYPFRRILGVELLPALHHVAQENLRAYKSDSQRCFLVEAVCGDAREFVFPNESIVLYLFNPLPESGLIELMANLDRSLNPFPRTAYVLYHNPLLEHVLTDRQSFNKIGGTHQYSIFRSVG